MEGVSVLFLSSSFIVDSGESRVRITLPPSLSSTSVLGDRLAGMFIAIAKDTWETQDELPDSSFCTLIAHLR